MQLAWGFQSSRAQITLLILALFSLASFTAASTPTSFCKCTCFSNSTIIPLDPAKSGTSSSTFDNVLHLHKRALDAFKAGAEIVDDHTLTKRAAQYKALSCNDCNRKFCLDYELPTCKGAKEDDVFTTCFQRDSRKDEAVVFIFIFATGGLLVWAILKPWIERYLEAARERRSYMPVNDPEN
ncbi:uncharacterized protein N7477_003047 [Penicillium maclennaniae]|uniref:uncharacterized protein n=1 Tax=Penicillium maclennaniae TaxID=1343394 RepID=UPI002540178F|nr:uncharacterized protein N7477_003047 [Penicillium maclennaniae]KAJ5677414.1 hypothetical protein N7477_003047 [Penicillium maclennaniae]